MIEQGSPFPSIPVRIVTESGVEDTTSDRALGTGRVVFFTVPGAFTPTCHLNHLPGFVANADKLRSAGVDRIVCGAVNDHFVLKAWAEATGALGRIDFLADGNAALAEALGMRADKSDSGMGARFQRGALVIENGVVVSVFVEDAPGVSGSGAPAILMALEAANG